MKARIPSGHPSIVIPELLTVVSRIVNRRSVKMFYVGRGVDPYRRVKFHGSDIGYVLYQTRSIQNEVMVESTLIDYFYSHPKCANTAVHGRGRVSSAPIGYVYLAIWV
jgi:hypothetical protein